MAPILFVVHAVLAGSSFVVLNLLGCRAIGPNGFIDFLLYNLPLGIGKTVGLSTSLWACCTSSCTM